MASVEMERRRRAAAGPGRRTRPAGRKFEKFYTQYDFMMLFMTVAIALFGVLMIYSASSYTASTSRFNNPYRFVTQQLFGLALGIAAMLIVSNGEFQWLMVKIPLFRVNLVQIAYFGALVLQTIVLIPGIGKEHNGARRWLGFGPVDFQPSEISKIAVILFISYAVYKSRSSLDSFGGFVRIMVYIAPFILLIAAQNLSTAIIVAGIAVGMCFVASKKKAYFVGCALALFGLAAAYALLGGGFRAGRIEAWLDVENSAKGYQILQGLYAIASGGLFGSGLGESMQKLGYIPEAYNDMIFAVICEELGVVGAVLVMLAFLVLLWRIVMVACNAPDIFGSMICIGVMIHIAIQVILNIAVVTNSIPSTGVPLPLISYGGTSAAIMMAELGLVLSVSRQVKLK